MQQRYLAAFYGSLLKYYGRNFPIDYKDRYNFEEQWEDKKRPAEKEFYNYQNLTSGTSMVFEICRMFVFAVTIWFSTIEFFIKEEGKMLFYL
jgi:hypothetical protein